MIKKSITTLAALAGLLLTAGSASAAVIAEYTFLNSNVTSSDTELNSTAQNFAKTSSDDLGYSNSGDNAFARSQALAGTDEAAAIANAEYFSFTVSANTGYELDLTSLTYTSLHNTTYDQSATPDGSATMNFFVRSSVDGYATNVGSVFSQDWNTNDSRTITLSGNSAFQDLTGDITFRLYAYESVELNTNQGARWDNVVLNGAVVAVPEPGAYALLAGCLGLTWVMLRRRR